MISFFFKFISSFKCVTFFITSEEIACCLRWYVNAINIHNYIVFKQRILIHMIRIPFFYDEFFFFGAITIKMLFICAILSELFLQSFFKRFRNDHVQILSIFLRESSVKITGGPCNNLDFDHVLSHQVLLYHLSIVLS